MTEKIDPNAAIDFMYENAVKFSQAKANRFYLEEYRKTLKAELMKEALQKGFEAVNAQEREAYSHATYKAHLSAIKSAMQLEEQLRWQLIAAQARVDVWRSQEASNRAMDRVTM
jgi:ABC-type transport system involved in cytochrome c biogenesis ATPase subunit